MVADPVENNDSGSTCLNNEPAEIDVLPWSHSDTKKGNERKGRQKISKSVNLQEEVTRVRNHLWSKYGPNNISPFDPKSMKDDCDEAGAKTLFPALLSAMSPDDQSQNRELQNETKCVTIINMLMFDQSQKASWF